MSPRARHGTRSLVMAWHGARHGTRSQLALGCGAYPCQYSRAYAVLPVPVPLAEYALTFQKGVRSCSTGAYAPIHQTFSGTPCVVPPMHVPGRCGR